MTLFSVDQISAASFLNNHHKYLPATEEIGKL